MHCKRRRGNLHPLSDRPHCSRHPVISHAFFYFRIDGIKKNWLISSFRRITRIGHWRMALNIYFSYFVSAHVVNNVAWNPLKWLRFNIIYDRPIAKYQTFSKSFKWKKDIYNKLGINFPFKNVCALVLLIDIENINFILNQIIKLYYFSIFVFSRFVFSQDEIF